MGTTVHKDVPIYADITKCLIETTDDKIIHVALVFEFDLRGLLAEYAGYDMAVRSSGLFENTNKYYVELVGQKENK